MSEHYYHYEGFGITTEPLEYGDIEKIKKIAKEMTGEDYSEVTSINDLYTYVFPTDCNEEGVGAFFAALIQSKENIPITYGITDNDQLLIYTASYPWQEMTKQEKALTKEKLIDIFKKYQELIGIPKERQEEAQYRVTYGYC